MLLYEVVLLKFKISVIKGQCLSLFFTPFIPINSCTFFYIKLDQRFYYMIQLTETEKNNVVWPENSPYKSYKTGKLPSFLPHLLVFVDIQVHIWQVVMTYPKGKEIYRKIKNVKMVVKKMSQRK